MTEIEQLKQDHAAIKAAVDVHKKYGQGTPSDTVDHIERRIARLEAEAADPWRDAKAAAITVEKNMPLTQYYEKQLARYVRHLESENSAKDARIAELEAREDGK